MTPADPPELDDATRVTNGIPRPTGDRRSEPAATPPAAGAAAPAALPKRFGRYDVVGELGRGGFGVVYAGHDPQLGRRVAIKVATRVRSAEQVEALRTEARRLAQLRHPGVLTVHDVGVDDGVCYIVTDLLDGEPLNRVLARRRYDWPEAVAVVAAVADALAHAHAAGIVHRDVKPANVLVTADGRPVLIDFGIALADEEAGGASGSITGTPLYMPPEQARGQANRVDGRTDVYSLGAVLYQLVAGRPPFRGDDVDELLRKIVEDEPQPLRQLAPAVPAGVAAACHRALAKRMTDRFVTAGDFAAALRAAASAAATPAGAPAQPGRTPAEPPRTRREAERRHVSVVVVTAEPTADPADRDGPERGIELARLLLKVCEECVGEAGGSVLASTGPGVAACFGFPVSHEDAARRAVRAALAVARRVAPPDGPAAGPTVLAVVHSGEVVAEEADADRPGQVTLAGDVLPVASRLADQAEPGGVTVTAATHALIRDYFETTAAGTVRVRGAAGPVELFRVVGEAAAPNRVETANPANLSPLVGRDHEVGILLDRWERAAEGFGQVVLLVGEPGLGKSRLVREVREAVSARSADGTAGVIEWRCSAYHRNTGFYPATEAFGRLLGFGPGDPPGDRLDRLAAHLDGLGLTGGDDLALLAALLCVPADGRCASLSLSPQRQKERTVDLVLAWLAASAAGRPLVFVVEDLHWADPSTLELLGRHVAEAGHHATLTVLTARPEFRPAWPDTAQHTRIGLGRLTRRQVGELLGHLPPDVADRVAARTDGVPLFVEEFGKLVREAGLPAGGETVGASDSTVRRVIPTTLQDLLTARLERVTGDPSVAQLAATIGREFGHELIAAASDLPPDRLAAELDKLVGAELLFRKGRPPKCTYTFKHALIQDAAHNSMLTRKRQQNHRRIADVLEARFPGVAAAQPELLAHHFTEAGDARKAVDAWLAAGQRSQHQGAFREAVSHYRRGLEAVAGLPAGPERDGRELGLQLPLGVSLLAAKGYAAPSAGPTFDRCRELGERVADPATLFYILWGSWAWRVVRSDLAACREYERRILDLAAAQPDPSWTCEAHFVAEVNGYYGGAFAAARRHADEAVRRFDPTAAARHAAGTGQDVRAGVLSFHGLILWSLGLPDQALAAARGAVAVCRGLNQPMSLSFALHHAASVMLCLRRWDDAIALADEAHAVAAEQVLPLWAGSSRFHRAAGRFHRGGGADALREMWAGFEAFVGTGARNVAPMYLTLLADAHRRLGESGPALDALDRAARWAADHDGQNFYLAETHRVRGDVLRALGTGAEESYRSALAVARDQEGRGLELRAAVGVARMLRDAGRHADAVAELRPVVDGYDEGFETPDYTDARALLDELIGSSGGRESVG